MSVPPPVYINDLQHAHEIARFVIEGDPHVNRLVSEAAEKLRILTRGEHESFASAVQKGTPEILTDAVEVLYLHLEDQQLRYEFELAYNLANGEQQVQLPDTSLLARKGTCIDLAVLFLSAVIQAKMLPVYLQLNSPHAGHAMAAVWIDPPTDRDEIFSLNEVRQHVQDQRLLVLEATGFASGFPGRAHPLKFQQARQEARKIIDSRAWTEGWGVDICSVWQNGTVVPSTAEGSQVRPWRPHVPFQFIPLPAHFVARPEPMQQLHDALMKQEDGPGVVVSSVWGLGGVGKSTLVSALVQARQVRQRFGGGILWVTLGQEPNLLQLLSQCIRDLGDDQFQATELRQASSHLGQLLLERSVLLVLDDAWRREDIDPFRVAGERCRLLVTTRRASIAEEWGARCLELQVLTIEQSLDLLSKRLERPLQGDERQQASELAEVLGCHPLALELAGPRIKRGKTWKELIQALRGEVAALEVLEDPADRMTGKARLEASFNYSLRALHTEAPLAYQCFLWLGVIPEDALVTAPMASTLWQVGTEEASILLEYLWSEALLLPAVAVLVGQTDWPGYRMHDLMHDHARRLLTSAEQPRRTGGLPGLGLTLPQAHQRMLERYRERTREGQWHTLQTDGYIHKHLSWHLQQAGDVDGLHALLREQTPEGRNGWYSTNERLGDLAVFVDDVNRAWNHADEAVRQGHRGKWVGLQCRYALVNASLRSLAGNLPPELVGALVSKGIWGVALGLTHARHIPGLRQKVDTFVELLPHVLPTQRQRVQADALDAAANISDQYSRSSALSALAPHLPLEQGQAALQQALDAAANISHEYSRSRALSSLLPQLMNSATDQVVPRWVEVLHLLAKQTRANGLSKLQQLTPVLVSLGGSDAVVETTDAIADVGRWWP